MWVRQAGAGLCRRGRVNKEPFMNPSLWGGRSGQRQHCIVTLWQETPFSGSPVLPLVTCLQASDPLLPSLSEDGGVTGKTSPLRLRPQLRRGGAQSSLKSSGSRVSFLGGPRCLQFPASSANARPPPGVSQHPLRKLGGGLEGSYPCPPCTFTSS